MALCECCLKFIFLHVICLDKCPSILLRTNNLVPMAPDHNNWLQIALRAVREMSLPDACAELLLADLDGDREREPEDWEQRDERDERWPDHAALDCCRSLGGSGSLRCASAGSLHIPMEGGRTGTAGRRELAARPDAQLNRQSVPECAAGARLSAAVPDVAMAPNANTHLLTARDYFRHAPPWEYSGGGVLQLDLGDGATHTPRPGSRAQRAGAAQAGRQQRDHAPAMSCLRSRADEDELRAAIELSVIRAYSGACGGAAPSRARATLPHAHAAAPPRSRASPQRVTELQPHAQH
ncbi:uncharacterized protein LOC113491667 isoform X3 [Trichoplusia ni]|uniref:Uncharacterized protein LOC113491667 isoform X3 n=1 Tax=Trichoplusia ni TaxID=7111 RepID=A0A7E5V8E0_TRINI|nr:uncharacterized protein LOC113491667 isoform X3 [Trichoplusia ni]